MRGGGDGDGRGNSPQFLPHPKHSQPSQAHCLLNSCRHHPILLSFHRRSVGGANQISRGEEIGEGLAASLRAPSLSLSCSCFTRALLCTHNYTRSHVYTDAHTHTHIHRYSHAEDKKERRVALGDRGLGERRMLAVKGPDPSLGKEEPPTPATSPSPLLPSLMR